MRFTKWSALLLVPHAILQAISIFVVFETSATDVPRELQSLLTNTFTSYLTLLPCLYYIVFSCTMAYIRGYGPWRLMAILGASIPLSAVTLIGSYFGVLLAFLPSYFFVIDWTGLSVGLEAEFIGSLFPVSLLTGGALFGFGLLLGLRILRLCPVTRRALLANVLGCAIGSLFVFIALGSLSLPTSHGDRGLDGSTPWLWWPVAIIGALPHVYLTWRAFWRGLPIVAPAAG